MISRRLLRIKALQIFYAYHMSDDRTLNKSEKELLFSVGKSYELYHLLILLLVEISIYAEKRIEIKKSKHFPTEEEANPNTSFINNPLIIQIRENNTFLRYIDQHHISWVQYPELVKHLYNKMIESEEYSAYMESPDKSYNQYRSFLFFLIEGVLADDDFLSQVLEERSIFWNDDLEFAAGMVAKTLDKCKEGKALKLLPKFKDEEDKEFLINLFRKSVLNEDENREIIKKLTKNWDFDRIAHMDILIMVMAIAEAMEFSSIPTKVTLNEYIEIAKFYSTEKSSIFINGILDKTFEILKTEKKIKKTGRGLIGETK